MAEVDQARQGSPQTTGQGLSFKGLYEVFTAPGALFAKLKEQPRILVPYIVYAIVVAAFFYATADIIVRMQMQAIQERTQNLPPGALNAGTMKLFAMLGGIVFLLAPLVASALAVFFGNFIMGGKARFKQLLSVMLYGEIVYALGMIVTLPMILAKDSMLVSLSLGVLVPNPGPQNLLYVALSKIGVFNIWEIIVVGIGLTAVYGFSRNKGYLLSVLSMGMLSILNILSVVIGQAFS
ncbi:MAG TPA: YIP1 family protein [Acidobacteriota bacterium]|nr:YIP1 family protein [Acidobacteriota bacterium]